MTAREGKVIKIPQTRCAIFTRDGAEVAICWNIETDAVVFVRKLTPDLMYKPVDDVIRGLEARGWIEKKRYDAW